MHTTTHRRPTTRAALLLASMLACASSMLASAASWSAAYSLPENGNQVVGAVTVIRVHYEDTLASVAQKYGLGYREVIDANPGVDPWIPGEGTKVMLPTEYVLPDAPRDGVVINIPEYRLYYYPPGGKMVVTYPVGLGRDDFRTPVLTAHVVTAIRNPAWTPTAASRKEHAAEGDPLPHVVPPGPDNPLGHMALQLDVPGYFIHGTNQPFGVGQMVSHGCIRLYDDHIATLAELAKKGTPVHIVNEPYKVGWRNGHLFVEVHHAVYGDDDPTALVREITKATKDRATVVDWARVDDLIASPTGVPEQM